MIDVATRVAVAGVDPAPLVRIIAAACAEMGIVEASVGLMVVDATEMTGINHEHRGKDGPTDVLSFPVDGPDLREHGWDADGPPPELGDIVICPQAARDPLTTLAVHGLLHLVGYDHETDGGEMLALQDRLLERLA